MFSRSIITAARRAAVAPTFRPIARRAFTASVIARGGGHHHHEPEVTGPGTIKPYSEIKKASDLVGPGAEPGTVPTDLEQATGLERLEILGKMDGIDVFDMKPLDASRMGTLENPIIAKGFGEEHYVGCTGFPADSHVTMWLTLSRTRPVERCPECGNVIKMEYVGPEDAHNDAPEDKKTMADFVKQEYWYN
ncbi:Cytochrome c oxidase subunit 4 [Orbilia ellipsospora]|uniref:Cytochrome c oxidase subunit 4, mitochondrial n=1 Tax=Orbilia ellipsospora TaxID=2528407 RepID=A0AAV9XAR6_9PEZI